MSLSGEIGGWTTVMERLIYTLSICDSHTKLAVATRFSIYMMCLPPCSDSEGILE